MTDISALEKCPWYKPNKLMNLIMGVIDIVHYCEAKLSVKLT